MKPDVDCPVTTKGKFNSFTLKRLTQALELPAASVLYIMIFFFSEQRRRFQQQHSDLGSAQLDELMREHWEGLGDKERLRYYQRAWHALNDKNRHGRATGGSHSAATRTPSASRSLQRTLLLQTWSHSSVDLDGICLCHYALCLIFTILLKQN